VWAQNGLDGRCREWGQFQVQSHLIDRFRWEQVIVRRGNADGADWKVARMVSFMTAVAWRMPSRMPSVTASRTWASVSDCGWGAFRFPAAGTAGAAAAAACALGDGIL
jgi:hypothetical protein